jgi:hypothetical protein
LRGTFYLTLRNDTAGYVSVSDDGLHFSEPKKWCWTDGSDLGNYNTQQHWVTHQRSRLYLVYTRRGANNDHVFRHRAPLFMAEVDQKTLAGEARHGAHPRAGARRTARQLRRVRGERERNLGHCGRVDADAFGPDIVIKPDNAFGADNSVWAARILWKDAK